MLRTRRQLKMTQFIKTENTLARYYSAQIYPQALFTERYQFAQEIVLLMLSCGWQPIDGELELKGIETFLDTISQLNIAEKHHFNFPVGAVDRETPEEEHGKKDLREDNIN